MTWLANVGNASILSVSIDSSGVCFTASSSDVYVMACTAPAKQQRSKNATIWRHQLMREGALNGTPA
jgi:hypothetical protein